VKKLLLLVGFVLVAGPVQGQDKGPIKLTLTANPAPAVVLHLALLPELREQVPGNAAPLYRQAADLLGKIPETAGERTGLQTVMYKWESMPLDQLPRDEVRKVLALYKEPLELLDKATRSEYCDWELAERLRVGGFNADLGDMQKLRNASVVFGIKAKLELADNRPDRAVHTLRGAYILGKRVGESPTLICHLIGIALTTRANNLLEQVLAHPRTPNLSWSLASLPQPFMDCRKSFEGERVAAYAAFPGALDLANNPDAGPLPPEKIEKMTKVALLLPNAKLLGLGGLARRFLLSENIRIKHDKAKEALIALGRPRDQVEKWPHAQVAVMHALAEYDKLLDEGIKWQSFPYWQARPALEQIEDRMRRNGIGKLEDSAIDLASEVLPAFGKVILARHRLDRQFAALRCVEAIRLYAAEHKGQLPATLADIKEVPVPVCPITGKPFEYHRTGNATAVLTAPPVPKLKPSIQPLSFELMLRR
jgi:hypothetical protein